MAACERRPTQRTEETNIIDQQTRSERPLPAWVLLFALLLPTGITWVYFVLLAKEPAFVQRGAYLLGKALQFVLPLACVGIWRRGFSLPIPQRRDLLTGLATGVVIATAAWLGYRYALLPSAGFSELSTRLQQKLAGMQLNGPTAFIFLGCFYSLAHSLFEEYYWRWFVFGALRVRLPWGVASAISSVGFAAHHVLVLAAYFDGLSGMTVLLSLAVAVGGLLWSAIYQRSGLLYGVWLSHLLVDAALFTIGYDLLQTSLKS